MGYLDPGIFGMISQVGYVLLFAAVSALTFFFQPLKNLFNRVFRRNTVDGPSVEAEDVTGPRQPGV